MTNYTNHVFLGQHKPLGAYLVEAGLLTEAQVGVALADQSMTSMRFGEIIATRGWVKEQTIEYIMHKVVIPERSTQKKTYADLESGLVRQGIPPAPVQGAYKRNNSKGGTSRGASVLQGPKTTTPPTATDEEGVSWIG
jgi:hypothetical protein